jgi:hypothetical protein
MPRPSSCTPVSQLTPAAPSSSAAAGPTARDDGFVGVSQDAPGNVMTEMLSEWDRTVLAHGVPLSAEHASLSAGAIAFLTRSRQAERVLTGARGAPIAFDGTPPERRVVQEGGTAREQRRLLGRAAGEEQLFRLTGTLAADTLLAITACLGGCYG